MIVQKLAATYLKNSHLCIKLLRQNWKFFQSPQLHFLSPGEMEGNGISLKKCSWSPPGGYYILMGVREKEMVSFQNSYRKE